MNLNSFGGGGSSGLVLPSAYKHPYLHRAIAQPAGGVQDRKMLWIGDSHETGATNPIAGNVSLAMWLTIAQMLKANANCPCQLGGAIPNLSTTFTDARWAQTGTDWTATSLGAHFGWGASTFGGVVSSTVANNTLRFTPNALAATAALSYDTFDVYYLTGTSSTFNINIDGGTAVSIGTGASPGIAILTVSAAAASNHVLNVSVTAAGLGVGIIFIEPRLSTTPTLRLAIAGVGSTTSINWSDTTSSAYGPLACIAAYNPDVVVFGIGADDILNATNFSTATLVNNLNAIVAACQVGGSSDIVVMGIVQQSQSTFPGTAANLQLFNNAEQAWAAQNGYPFVDVNTAWGGIAGMSQMQTLGYYDSVGTEFLPLGYADRGRLTADVLLAA